MSTDAARSAVLLAVLAFGAVIALSRTRPPTVPRLAGLGFRAGPWWLADCAIGLLLGAAAAGLTAAVLLGSSSAQLITSTAATDGDLNAWRDIAISAIGCLALVLWQGLIARGVTRFGLGARWNLLVAGLGSIALFALFYISVPGANLLSTVGVLAAGLALTYATYISRLLWLSLSVHLGWLLTGSVWLGAPLAGDSGTAIWRLVLTGPDWMTGGSFGIWGGAIGIGANLAIILALWLWARVTDRVVPLEQLSRSAIL